MIGPAEPAEWLQSMPELVNLGTDSQGVTGVGGSRREEQNSGRGRGGNAGGDARNKTTSGSAAHEDFPS